MLFVVLNKSRNQQTTKYSLNCHLSLSLKPFKEGEQVLYNGKMEKHDTFLMKNITTTSLFLERNRSFCKFDRQRHGDEDRKKEDLEDCYMDLF